MKKKEKTVLEEMYERAERAGRPLSVHFELTDRCNLECRHCYVVRGRADSEMSAAEVKRALEEMAEAGVIFLTLTGGEPLVREDFFEIAGYARSLNFSLRIFTNGTLVDEAAADRLAGLAPQEIGISLYSSRAETHEYITRAPGSFGKSAAAVRMLTARGVRVVVKSVLMNVNFAEYGELIELARSMGATYTFDPTVFPRDDGGREPLGLRLADGQLEAALADTRLLPGAGEIPNAESADTACRVPTLKTSSSPSPITRHPSPKKCRGPVCDLGVVCLAVSAAGEVFPCLQFRRGFGNFKEKGLKEIIMGIKDSQILSKLKDEKEIKVCYDCNVKTHCTRCPGLAELEDGDAMGPSGWACRLARIRKAGLRGKD